MVETEEADMGWDVGVEQIEAFPAEQLRFGSSAETYTLQIDTAWHPELRMKESARP